MALIQSPEYVWRYQSDPIYASGTLSSGQLTAFFRSDISNGSAIISQPSSDPASLVVDLVQNGASAVTIGGTSYTYASAVELIAAIIAQERTNQLPK